MRDAIEKPSEGGEEDLKYHSGSKKKVLNIIARLVLRAWRILEIWYGD